MTKEEIIDFLKFERETTIKLINTCKSNQTNYFKKRVEAYNMAIKSLETCEKVKEEIETEIKAYDETVTFHRGIRIGLKIAEEFIDNHLLEVSE